MVPGLTRVGSISNMSNAAARAIWKEFQEATAIAGIEAHLLDVRTPSDIVSAFDGARKQRINALLVTIDTLTQTNQQLIIELTTKHQLPAIFMSREFVDAGGLMSLRRALSRSVSPRRHARAQDFQWCKARRSAGRAADPVRVRDQSTDRQGARSECAG